MNINKLTTLAITDPGARASTAQFRLAGKTLWHKWGNHTHDNGRVVPTYLPALSHFGDFIVNWNMSPWDLNMSSRTSNMFNDMRNTIHGAWLAGLSYGNPYGSTKGYSEDDECSHPAVEIRWSALHRDMRVTKPNEMSAKMLLLGKHPDNDTTRRSWHGLMNAEDPELEKTLPELTAAASLESALQCLAFGAISKENTMKTLASVLGHMKTSMDTQANSMVDEMERQAGLYFAPPADQSGRFKSHLADLTIEMRKLEHMARNIQSACNTLKQVGASPDSQVPKVESPSNSTWDCAGLKRAHDLAVGNYPYYEDTAEPLITADSRKYHPTLKVKMGLMELVDWHSRSFSYYWVRRNISHYINVLSHVGVVVPPLFGQSPEEWDYATLAAPVFLNSQAQ
tara:strand:+ start:10746 stop:11936 length:1191 start_codon:yes stop_codon:yes gene_type:complete